MDLGARIYVAGHRGLVGSALVRCLRARGYVNLITKSHDECDLTDWFSVDALFAASKPEYVFLAAAKVGGILANDSYPADFIAINLAIQSNVIEASRRHGVRQLLFLGSSCIYPHSCQQPIKEEYLLTGPLEPTNRPYAIAKIAGIEMCWAYNRQHGTKFLTVMPTNLYGPGDNYDLANSHVIPALIRKMHHAKVSGDPVVTVWGSGAPRREFLYSEDMADACVYLMNLSEPQLQPILAAERNCGTSPVINIGVGEDQTIGELAQLIATVVDFRGGIVFDKTKPDGTPRKLLAVGRLRELGWFARTSLRDGLERTYNDFIVNRIHKS